MAKTIEYKFLSAEVNKGTADNPIIEQIIFNKEMTCKNQTDFDINYQIAEKEAIGEITVSGEFDPIEEEATADDVLNALLGVI